MRKVVAIIEGRKVGYARVSSTDQNLDMQIDALKKAGCDPIFAERFTGATAKRLQLQRALATLQPGDTFVTWKLDRAARSLMDLLHMVSDFKARNVHFQSLTEKIDTSSPHGQFVFHIMGAMAEFQRAIIRENQREGIKAARKRGKHLGRPRKLTDEQLAHARKQIAADKATPADMAQLFNVDRVTLYRALRRTA